MNELVQQQAAEQGGLFLNLAFEALEGRNSELFFFFFGISMGIFKHYNIKLIIKDEKGN
jgi:hypothetical protein